MKTELKTLLLTAAVLLVIRPVFPQGLYNIDFNTQHPNQVVQAGSAPDFVSSINYGSPMVMPAFGALQDQPLVLDMAGNDPSFFYDQIQLNLPRVQFPVLNASFDFTSSSLAGSPAGLTLHFDTADGVRNLSFLNDGGIYLGDRFISSPKRVGSFSDGEAFRVSVQIGFQQKQWSVSKNGVLLGAVSFDQSAVYDIRFSYGLQSASATPDLISAVAIDNIVVAVPEPSSWGLLILGATCGLGYRRFCKGKNG